MMTHCSFFRSTYQQCSNRISAFKNAQTCKTGLAGLVPGYYAISVSHHFSDYLGNLIDGSDHAPFYVECPVGLTAFLIGYTLGALSCMGALKLLKPAPAVDAASILLLDDSKGASSEHIIQISSEDKLFEKIDGVAAGVKRLERMFEGIARLRLSTIEDMSVDVERIKKEIGMRGARTPGAGLARSSFSP